jgi:hypothetical protein
MPRSSIIPRIIRSDYLAKAAEGMAERRVAQKQNAVPRDNGVEQHSKSVQIAVGLYRKMSVSAQADCDDRARRGGARHHEN